MRLYIFSAFILFRIDLFFIKWSISWPEQRLRQGFLLSVSVSVSVSDSDSVPVSVPAEFPLSQQFVRLVCHAGQAMPSGACCNHVPMKLIIQLSDLATIAKSHCLLCFCCCCCWFPYTRCRGSLTVLPFPPSGPFGLCKEMQITSRATLWLWDERNAETLCLPLCLSHSHRLCLPICSCSHSHTRWHLYKLSAGSVVAVRNYSTDARAAQPAHVSSCVEQAQGGADRQHVPWHR